MTQFGEMQKKTNKIKKPVSQWAIPTLGFYKCTCLKNETLTAD